MPHCLVDPLEERRNRSRRTRISFRQNIPIIVVVCLELRHVLSPKGPRRPLGRPWRARRVCPDEVVVPRKQTRAKVKAFLWSYPKAAYMSEVERGRAPAENR